MTLPETAKEALEMWDNDTSIATLEMGGIGPTHEQTIHIGVFELIRQFIETVFSSNTDEAYPLLDKALRKIDKEKNLQISSAQAGAIKSLAYHYLTCGYASTINTYGNKRTIMISRKFPMEEITK